MTARKLTYTTKTNVTPVATAAQQATAEDFNNIKEVVNVLADESTAKGKLIVRVHNPDLTFITFADTTTATPGGHVANNAWIAIETGTIFGIAATVGQIIVDNGAAYVAQNISPTVADNAITNDKIADAEITASKFDAPAPAPSSLDVLGYFDDIGYTGLIWNSTVGTGALAREDSPVFTGAPEVPGYIKDVVHTVQSLDTDFAIIAFDASLGYNAIITITDYIGFGLTMSNLVAGTSGKITVINNGDAGSITIGGGYVNLFSPGIYSGQDLITTSVGVDVFNWYYDGTRLFWSGELGYSNE